MVRGVILASFYIYKMARYKVMSMNTGYGNKIYTIMLWDGSAWKSSRPYKEYKTLAGANKEMKLRKSR